MSEWILLIMFAHGWVSAASAPPVVVAAFNTKADCDKAGAQWQERARQISAGKESFYMCFEKPNGAPQTPRPRT